MDAVKRQGVRLTAVPSYNRTVYQPAAWWPHVGGLKTIVIFDFDGTIADSVHLFIEAINKSSERFRYKRIREEEVMVLRGKRPGQILKHLGISLLKLPFVLKRVRREVNTGVAQAKPAVEIKETLLELKKGGCEIGILTSNTEQNVKEFLINNDLDVFDFLYSGSSMFGKGRILRAIIRKNRLQKRRIYYVGDEIRDIYAARKTKVKMIAASWGFNTMDALRREGPDFIAESPDDIRDIVLGKKE